ncbi:hypothetical protein SUGI_0814510 [Cryptomeria japonica]|uniref:protein argonaute 2-like n=1 Tax=Cryptomeria japonica TaxID=3369 RepID=UPI002414776E|nr:protein argonaute 2-like [Cryptomeria japonica]GLJ39838.1 hypothetical protein SUGI_0814510 [Cryptomeria japonica]
MEDSGQRGRGRVRVRVRGRGIDQNEERQWKPTGRGRGPGVAPSPVTPTLKFLPSPSPLKGKHPPKPQHLALGKVETHKPKLGNSSASSCGSGGDLEPMSRPDPGGKNGYTDIRLIANHFVVNYDPSLQIFQYDVDMTLKSHNKTPKSEARTTQSIAISRTDAHEVKNRLVEDRPDFKKALPIYDGERKLYCLSSLLDGEFYVKLDNGEVKEYKVVLKFVKKLDGHRLEEFLRRDSKRHSSYELLQAMGLVIREHPSKNMIIIGSSLYDQAPERHRNLTGGAAAAIGYSISLSPTAKGLSLKVDYSVVAFHKSIRVLDYLRDRRVYFRENCALNSKARKEVERVLRGLKVSVTHRRTKQKFTVRGLTEQSTRQLTFKSGEREEKRQLVDYFSDRYHLEIRFLELPCLDVSRNPERPNYIPMELCEICVGQRFPKDDLNSRQFQKLTEVACPKVRDRFREIIDIVKRVDGPTGGSVLESYHMSVGSEMTDVTGRVIAPPKLRLGNSCEIIPRQGDCQWNLHNRQLFDPKPIDKWGIVSFLHNPKEDGQRKSMENFCRAMVVRFKDLGIQMAEKPTVFESRSISMLDNVPHLRNSLQAIHRKSEGKLQILICIMGAKHSGYKNLKLICETEIGLISQCCDFECVLNFNDIEFSRYLANLALKINAKVGGSNVALARTLSNQFPRFGNSHVVYFGADVNHPGQRNEKSPSIAAVVMSINWPYSTRYVFKMRCQESGQEDITDLGDMCKELLSVYLKKNSKLPERVVFFRDGVSEGQFHMVLNKELMDLRRAFGELQHGYNPSVSLIVAQKRHHTRLFPVGNGGTKSGNVPPGTVVDSVIVHPREFDFFLCSHDGQRGTSKPTHYHVLWDDNEFGSDELQKLINDLCYTYSRCTKPISLVPPVYYADLAAYRGRLYVEALASPHFNPSSSSAITLPKIHQGIEDEMFI